MRANAAADRVGLPRGVCGLDDRVEAGLERRHGHLSLEAAIRFGADRSLGAISASDEATDWQTTPRDYPRFLGNGYWAEVGDVQLATDWTTYPPQLVWRHEIGAGWSAFAIVGNYAITQEQRGDDEIVACYRLDNGQVVWTHADATRFDPADFQGGLGGIGPRATPTIHDGKVLTQGGPASSTASTRGPARSAGCTTRWRRPAPT